MEHVNNDMDDLFRKAGELYPLKTSGSDWDGVLGKLREDISGVTGSQPGLHAQENRNKRRWLLLLLLIPIGISSLVYFSGSGVKSLNSQLTNTTKDQKTNTKTRKMHLRRPLPQLVIRLRTRPRQHTISRQHHRLVPLGTDPPTSSTGRKPIGIWLATAITMH
jgi:hypothetical protein